MLKTDFFYEIKTRDGIALTNIFRQIFSDYSYVIFEGLNLADTGNPNEIAVSPGRCGTILNSAIIYNTTSETINLLNVHSQQSDYTSIPDGYHAFVICYDERRHESYWQLILELSPNNWDNIPSPIYIVLGVLEIQSGIITNIYDSYGPWVRVELGLGGGGSGSCSGDTCLIGCPTDGTFDDGAANILCNDTIADAVDKINELLMYLLPTPPGALDALDFTPTPVSGYISNQPNIAPLTAGQLHNYIFNTNNITGITQNTDKFSNADKGILEFYFNNSQIDTFDLGTHFNESEREGSQSYPPANSPNSYITINSVEWYNNFPAYQIGNASLNLSSLINVGSNIVNLRHTYGTQTDQTPDYILFYDDGGRPTITSNSLDSINIGNTKFLSGVRYYGRNTTLSISLAVQDLFNKTYLQNPVNFNSPDNLITNIDLLWNDPNATGYSNPPNWNDPWNLSRDFTVQNNIAVDRVNINITASDPFGSSPSVNILQNNRLFNTYDNMSTDLHEYFVDENYRLPDGTYDTIPSNITGQWDSTALLSNGNLQIFVDRLIYPHQNFTTGFEPTPQNADYSGFTGDQIYIRAFRDNSDPHNNGHLVFRGIQYSDLGSNLDIFIKLPTQTGWLDLSKPFNAATFTGSDGDGSMVTNTQNGDLLDIEWSSGTFTTANSGHMIIIKIIYHDLSPVILEMWNWGG